MSNYPEYINDLGFCLKTDEPKYFVGSEYQNDWEMWKNQIPCFHIGERKDVQTIVVLWLNADDWLPMAEIVLAVLCKRRCIVYFQSGGAVPIPPGFWENYFFCVMNKRVEFKHVAGIDEAIADYQKHHIGCAGDCGRTSPEFVDMIRQCQSPIEELLFIGLYSANLTDGLVMQHRIEFPRTIPDFVYPDHRLAIYCDSQEYHTSKEAMSRDRRIDRELLDIGWRSLRFMGRDYQTQDGMEKCLKAIANEYGKEV